MVHQIYVNSIAITSSSPRCTHHHPGQRILDVSPPSSSLTQHTRTVVHDNHEVEFVLERPQPFVSVPGLGALAWSGRAVEARVCKVAVMASLPLQGEDELGRIREMEEALA